MSEKAQATVSKQKYEKLLKEYEKLKDQFNILKDTEDNMTQKTKALYNYGIDVYFINDRGKIKKGRYITTLNIKGYIEQHLVSYDSEWIFGSRLYHIPVNELYFNLDDAYNAAIKEYKNKLERKAERKLKRKVGLPLD